MASSEFVSLRVPNFQEEIKNSKNLLSQKEKELDKALKEISIKKKEFESLINENSSKSEKQIKEKEMRIQQQQDMINKMNEKINQLQNELTEHFSSYDDQMVITNKKKQNDFLNKKSKEEIEQLKKELYEACRTIIKHEDAFIDLAFEMGPMEGLTAKDVKELREKTGAGMMD